MNNFAADQRNQYQLNQNINFENFTNSPVTERTENKGLHRTEQILAYIVNKDRSHRVIANAALKVIESHKVCE